MKNHGTWNLAIDGLMLVAMAIVAGLGFLMKFALLPGRERIVKYGDNAELYFLGLDRHQWGGVHLWTAYVLIGLLVLHIVLHWDMILCLMRKALPRRSVRLAVGTSLVLLCAVFLAFAFLIRPTRAEEAEYLHRNLRDPGRAAVAARAPHLEPGSGQDVRGEDTLYVPPAERPAGPGPDRDEEASGSHPRDIRGQRTILGSMTVADVARAYGVSVEDVRMRLGLPASVSGTDTMGRIRRAYGFTMREAEELLEKER
jgi:hypothetical protein